MHSITIRPSNFKYGQRYVVTHARNRRDKSVPLNSTPTRFEQHDEYGSHHYGDVRSLADGEDRWACIVTPPPSFWRDGMHRRWLRPSREAKVPKLPNVVEALQIRISCQRMKVIDLENVRGHRRQALVDLAEAATTGVQRRRFPFLDA